MNRSINHRVTSLVGTFIAVLTCLWAVWSVYQYEIAKRNLTIEQAHSLSSSPKAVTRASSGSNQPAPMTLSQGNLLSIIQKDSKSTGVTLKTITFGQGSHTTPPVAILVTGSFLQLESFLQDLQGLASSLQITSVNVIADPSGKSDNQMTMQVSTPLQQG